MQGMFNSNPTLICLRLLICWWVNSVWNNWRNIVRPCLGRRCHTEPDCSRSRFLLFVAILHTFPFFLLYLGPTNGTIPLNMRSRQQRRAQNDNIDPKVKFMGVSRPRRETGCQAKSHDCHSVDLEKDIQGEMNNRSAR